MNRAGWGGRNDGGQSSRSVTAGGPESHYAARGINGPILFPIHHAFSTQEST